MIPNSYLKSLITAIRQSIQVQYVSNGYIFQENNESINNEDSVFQWNAYGPLYPPEGSVFGAIASQFRPFAKNKNLDESTYNVPHVLLTQIELRTKGNQGVDFGLIYDHHEFIVNHLNKNVRINGVTGTYANNQLSQAFLGLTVTKAIAGVDLSQNDLSKQRSIIEFEWNYRR